MPVSTIKNVLIIPLCFIAILSASANTPKPSSALEYQQTTNTRIVVEENHLRFFTGGSERMTIDANGNVGIGTNAPTNPLSIKSNVLGQDLINAYNSEGNQIFEVGTLSDNESYLELNNKDGNPGLLYRTDNGLLQVNGLRVTENYSTSTETAWIHYKTGVDRQLGLLLTNDLRTKAEIKLWEGNSHNPYISFSTASAPGSDMEERMRVDKSGNVGIGTNSPADNLHIKGNKDFGDEPSIRLATEKYYGGSGGATNTVLGRIKFVNRDLNYSYRSEIIGLLTGGWADRVGLAFITSSGGQRYERMRIEHTGNVGIGTTDPAHKLHVDGDVRATKFRADGNTWADFVFDDEYQLSELSLVEQYIEKNHHLPEIPSAAEVQENGIDLVDMQAKLLQKIEELTLYVIEQNKKIENQSGLLQEQQKEIEKLKAK